MSNSYYLLIVFILLFVNNSYCQPYLDSLKTDTSFVLKEVSVKSSVLNSYSRIDYYKLKRKILKTHRFVDSVSCIIIDLDKATNNIQKKRVLNRYFRLKHKSVKKNFSKEIRQLTRSEGLLLSKMIYREFGVTVYELISIYRGSVRARFWHKVAQIYDGNLKVKYDTENIYEDVMIESIINKYL